MGDGSETVSKAPSVLIRELPNVSAPCGCLLGRHGFMHSQKRCPARPLLALGGRSNRSREFPLSG
jgi:hypothetical protein